MPDFAKIASPLHSLTKDVPFVWSEACDTAFHQLRNSLVTAPVLADLKVWG